MLVALLTNLWVVAQEVVQPRMMEQVVSCRDDIAQQYLMQCVIQGFPDECHLRTLPALLAALPELQAGVRVHLILASLLDRLARCARPFLLVFLLVRATGEILTRRPSSIAWYIEAGACLVAL